MSQNSIQRRAEELFDEYHELVLRGEEPDQAAYLTGLSAELRALVAPMLADYAELRGSLQAANGLASGRAVGEYRIVRELGRGRWATVWEAEQASLGRRVALKVLHSCWTLSPRFLERFRREARAAGRVSHRAIAALYESGETDGVHYLAEELVPGGLSLADRLADLRLSGTLPVDHYRDLAAFFAAVADGLASAHEAGVLHRDLKPTNILVGVDGEPKVVDFGLASLEDEGALTHPGELLGTIQYMSPEQATSGRVGVDHRTDVFSLGATLYEALTLVVPFKASRTELVLEKILHEDPVGPRVLQPSVPRDLAVICMKALEKRRDRRFASMRELRDDLVRYLHREPIRARPPGLVRRVAMWTAKHPLRTAVTFVASLLLVVGVARTGQVIAASSQANDRFRSGDWGRLRGHLDQIPSSLDWLLLSNELEDCADLVRAPGATAARLRAVPTWQQVLARACSSEEEALYLARKHLLDGDVPLGPPLSWYLHCSLRDALSEDSRSSVELACVAQILGATPDLGPDAVDSSSTFRSTLTRALQGAGPSAAVAERDLWILSALSGCGTLETLPTLLDFLEGRSRPWTLESREALRLGLQSAACILRRARSCGYLEDVDEDELCELVARGDELCASARDPNGDMVDLDDALGRFAVAAALVTRQRGEPFACRYPELNKRVHAAAVRALQRDRSLEARLLAGWRLGPEGEPLETPNEAREIGYLAGLWDERELIDAAEAALLEHGAAGFDREEVVERYLLGVSEGRRVLGKPSSKPAPPIAPTVRSVDPEPGVVASLDYRGPEILVSPVDGESVLDEWSAVHAGGALVDRTDDDGFAELTRPGVSELKFRFHWRARRPRFDEKPRIEIGVTKSNVDTLPFRGNAVLDLEVDGTYLKTVNISDSRLVPELTYLNVRLLAERDEHEIVLSLRRESTTALYVYFVRAVL